MTNHACARLWRKWKICLIKLQLVLQLIGCDRRWHDFVLPITGGTVVKVKHSCSNFHLEWKMTQAARLSIYGKLEVIEESRMWALLTSDNNNSLLVIIIIIIQMIIFIIIIICIFIIVITKFSNFPQWKRKRKEKSATYCYGLLYWRSNIKSVLDLRNFILVDHLIWIRKSEEKKKKRKPFTYIWETIGGQIFYILWSSHGQQLSRTSSSLVAEEIFR